METFPLAPTLAITRLGTVSPLRKFRLEATGRVVPLGNRVRKLAAVGLVTATLRTTAPAPVAGTPPTPATWTSIVWWGPTLAVKPPVPYRVSRMRAGDRPPYRPPAGWAPVPFENQ